MNKEAKLKYFAGGFDVIAQGDYVLCSVSKKKINLHNLRYWNVELQEAYFSPIEIAKKFSND